MNQNLDIKKTKISLISFGSVFIVAAIFSRELGLGTLFGLDIDWISYPIYVTFFGFLLVSLKLSISKKMLLVFFLITTSSLLTKFYLNLSVLPLIKQILPILLIYTVTDFILRRVSLEHIFGIYIKFAVVASVIGYLQFILRFFGILLFTDSPANRIDSIAQEPSHFAVIILPALIYTYINKKNFRLEFITVLIAVILTQNVTALSVFALSLILIHRKVKYLIVSIPILSLITIYLYEISQGFKLRADGMIDYILYQDIKNLQGTPLSFFSNFQVAIHNISINPLFGSGLGGHEESYYRYYNIQSFSTLQYLFGLNAKSGHSLSIRVLSELGLIGFGIYVYVLGQTLLIKATSKQYAISLACLSHFLCKSLKLGNYFDLGTPFFLLVLIYSYSEYKHDKITGNRI